MQECPTCPRSRGINNGVVAGKPTKQCKPCGCQLTRTIPRGKPCTTKINAVLLSLSGLAIHRIAFLLRVSTQAVLKWMRVLAQEHQEQPKPPGEGLLLELDEMWHDLKQQRQRRLLWKALDQDTGQLLDWACGRRDKVTLQKRVDRLAQWDVQGYGTDKWVTSASVISKGNLVQSKATTHDIEQDHCRQRHGFGRFKRQSIIVSKSEEMGDVTIALFAKCWVNGNQKALLPLLT